MAANDKLEVFPSKESIEAYQKAGAQTTDYICVGPKRFIMLSQYEAHMDAILNMPLRPSDIFVVTFPRSGTTWTQELVWLVANKLDFEKAKANPLVQRYAFLEQFMFFAPDVRKNLFANAKTEEDLNNVRAMVTPGHETLASAPSPRFIKTHLPLSLLPPTTLDSAKVVYVARDPRDVAVSLYHFFNSIPLLKINITFKEFFMNIFSKDLEMWSPFFEHIKEGWENRNHPNMLFLFYEELSHDLKGAARRMASFLGQQYSDDQLQQLCQHLDISNFQKNGAVDLKNWKNLGLLEEKANNFVRKGRAGGWRDHFDEEMSQRAEAWMEENLRDSDLRFPQ